MFIKKGSKFINAIPLWKKGLQAASPINAGASGGGGGNPLPSVSGLILHLDAAIDATVSQWDDQSVELNHAVQLSASEQPIITANNANLNNLPSVDFDSNDFMDIADDASLTVTNGFTWYGVCSVTSFISTFSFIFGHTNGTSWTAGWGLFRSSGNLRFYVNNWLSASQYALVPMSTLNGKSIIKCRYDKTNIELTVIGTDAGSDTQAYTANVTNVTDPAQIAYGGSGSYDINADYGEILYYDNPISAGDQTAIENYLKTKFNIA